MTYRTLSISISSAFVLWLAACSADSSMATGDDGGVPPDTGPGGLVDTGPGDPFDTGPGDPVDAGPVVTDDSGMVVPVDSGPVGPVDMGGTPTDRDSGAPPITMGAMPGSACNCDSDCQGTSTHPGVCLEGICMQQASSDCSAAGSTAECEPGLRCWGLTGRVGGFCFPDCASFACGGACDGDGSCVWDASSSCTATCSRYCSEGGTTSPCPPNSHLTDAGDACVCDDGYQVNETRDACIPECTTAAECPTGDVCTGGRCVTPPCTATSCAAGTVCSPSGACVIDLGTPPPGPVPTCAAGSGVVPDWRCTSGCGDLVPFDPDMGPGYWDYPINGETTTNQYRSYIRRDVMMLVKYAAAMVACQAGGWTFGNGGALGLGDMSERDGSIPGTSIGSPGHPAGTHVDGHDMDIAYFQTGTADNTLREICPHTSGGVDAYHCTGEPNLVDVWRTALFIAHLHASPSLRVIGVDGRVGPLVESAVDQLCAGGWVSGAACTGLSLAYEVTDTGRGWYQFHHHHLHVSISGS